MGRQARLRSQLYAALAQAFREPEVSSGKHGEHPLIQLLQQSALTLDAEALGPAVVRLVDALEITQGRSEQALRTLEIEYNRLFVGPGRPQATPYESFYRDKWGLLMGPSARDVERRYAEAGLALAPDHRDLPDHVATELGFMAYLAMQEAEANDEERQTWLERERSFLRDHLSVWLPAFCRRVQGAGRHPFYTALAELTVTFVALDRQRSADRQLGELDSDQSTNGPVSQFTDIPVSRSTDPDPRG
jgi:DMSO reductase family type II enzyme chaperone